jgi:hypothetical protein
MRRQIQSGRRTYPSIHILPVETRNVSDGSPVFQVKRFVGDIEITANKRSSSTKGDALIFLCVAGIRAFQSREFNRDTVCYRHCLGLAVHPVDRPVMAGKSAFLRSFLLRVWSRIPRASDDRANCVADGGRSLSAELRACASHRQWTETDSYSSTRLADGPHDFMARLSALAPKPRVKLTRFHGVFAPNGRLRSKSDPAPQRPARFWKDDEDNNGAPCLPVLGPASESRVPSRHPELPSTSGGRVKVIAGIENPAVIERVLEHWEQRARQPPPVSEPQVRAPPQREPPGFED